MKANEDKLLEKLVDNMMKDSVLETPSFDFTTKVMSQVLATKKSEVYVYKPLISKPVFIVTFGCFILLFMYLFINKDTQTNTLVNYPNFDFIHNINLSSIYNFPKITIYTVVLATFMLFIQISFLKKHFDNQFDK
jgi:hypothetical protein